MSQKTEVQSTPKAKKPVMPIIMGILSPILYVLFTVAFKFVANVLIVVKELVSFVVYTVTYPLDEAISYLPEFFEIYFDAISFLPEYLNQAIPALIATTTVTLIDLQPTVTLLAMALALPVTLMLLGKKGLDFSDPQRPKKGSVTITLAAVLLGLGIGGTFALFSLFDGTGNGILHGLLAPILADLSERIRDFALNDTPGRPSVILMTVVNLIRIYTAGNLLNTSPGFLLSIASLALHAVMITLIFGAAVVNNLKKRLPAVWVVILCTLFYVLFGGSPFGLIGTLIFGLLFALLCIKSDSITPPLLYVLLSSLTGQLLLSAPNFLKFDGYQLWRYVDNVYWYIYGWELYPAGTTALSIILFLAQLLLLLVVFVISLIPLIAGIVLLCVSGVKKKEKKEKTESKKKNKKNKKREQEEQEDDDPDELALDSALDSSFDSAFDPEPPTQPAHDWADDPFGGF